MVVGEYKGGGDGAEATTEFAVVGAQLVGVGILVAPGDS